MASIDRMDWHYEGNYPSELPTQNAGTHIGIFLAWAFSNGLIGELHLEENQDDNSPFLANYLDDYADIFEEDDLPTLYHLPNTWENFDKVKPILD